MQAKIIRLDPEIELPAYRTSESAGFDICAAEDKIIKAHEQVLIKTGLIIQAPAGHFLLIASRSSLPIKKGLILSNGVGIIDRDFSGPEDEIVLIARNFTQADVEIKKGERLANGLFLPVDQVEWIETDKINSESRGGLGSTGGYK